MQQNTEIANLISDIREQVLFLSELGIDSLNASLPEFRHSPPPEREARPIERREAPPVEKYVPAEMPKILITQKEQSSARPAAGSRIASMPKLSGRKPPTVSPVGKPTVETVSLSTPETPEPQDGILRSVTSDAQFGDPSGGLPPSNETIQDIHNDIGNCTRCPLSQGRTQIVHSVGNLQAELMFVGEAPGADEDAKGEPFVGRAGQLLTKIIEGIGYKREDVFIGNINRCRPPGNRAPTLPEAEACKPFLIREISIVRPKVIVVLGNTATQNLLNTKTGITKLRGNFQDYYGVKVMPTFHPAYLLRDPNKKREVWEDMKKVRDYLASLK